MKQIIEGGNVFKTPTGEPATGRIQLADITPTVVWLDSILPGLDLQDNMIGSTGQKPSSGDLDLAIDAGRVTKEQLVDQLQKWVQQQGQNPRDWIRKTGVSVHFKTPIRGDPEQGYVQTDFMFFAKPDFSKFMYRQDPKSEFKGMTRAVLINSIAKALGYRLNQNVGLVDRETGDLVTDDPTEIARMLLNPSATADSLVSVERIMAQLRNDPRRDSKVGDFLDYMQREGIPYQESIEESETHFLARLRDRIVNQGMSMIIEQEDVLDDEVLTEAEARIPHLEDLVFDLGRRGIDQALAIVDQAAKDTAGTVTVKWDGKPAVVFGRKPSGEFVLTDKSGFMARGYDGLVTSMRQLAGIMNMRGGDREDLIGLYQRLWPLLEASVPAGFRGYVQGDVLYTEPLVPRRGTFVFRPNTVTYQIPVESKTGREIAGTEAGIAVHTFLADPSSAAQPLKQRALQPVSGLFIGYPGIQDVEPLRPEPRLVQKVKQIQTQGGADMVRFLNPQALRQRQITDLPALMKRYVNSRIMTDFTGLAQGFLPWLESATTPRKLANIQQWISDNRRGFSATFSAFLALHALKQNLLTQLGKQVPGQEGFVTATDAGRVKFVDRFEFSRANRLMNQ